MKEAPGVTIGLPVFNEEARISRCMDALLCQTYKNFRLIISDNGSTDTTRIACQQYLDKDSRIQLIRQDKNMGAFNNFIYVLSQAKTPYFMWAAADDMWSANFLEELVADLERKPDCAVTMPAFDRVDEEGRRLDTVKFSLNKDAKLYFLGMAWGVAGAVKYNCYMYGLFRTEILQRAARVFMNVPAGDRIFISQLALGVKFSCVDKVLYFKTLRKRSAAVRYKEEDFSILAQRRFAPFYTAMNFVRTIFASEIVPYPRKFLGILVAIFSLGFAAYAWAYLLLRKIKRGIWKF